MGDRSVSRPHRYVALLFVVGLHFGLVTAFVLASRIRTRSAQSFVSTLVLLPNARTVVPAAAPAQMHLAPVAPLAPPTVPTPSITYPSVDDAPAHIDWQEEAQRAAAATARTRSASSSSVSFSTNLRRKNW